VNSRYLAICFPLEHRVTRRVARMVIGAIWCSACILLSPWAIYYEQRVYVSPLQTVYVCGQFGWPSERLMRGYFLGVVVVSCYTVPLLLVTVCYTLIGCRVWHRDTPEIANSSQVLPTSLMHELHPY
jgi:7 transmembrane receptor (rhodopsin family)